MTTEDQEDFRQMPVVIPDQHYLSDRYIVEIPADDERLKNKWELRKYAAKQVEKKLGDEVQLTSMKIRKPHIIAKSKAKLLKRQPTARLFVTVKF